MSVEATSARIAALSKWIDEGNAHRDPEAVTWGRLAKIAEEHGEVIEAFIGATGQNPRKGVTCGMNAVAIELLDVALTALAAYFHVTNHSDVMTRFDSFVKARCERVGVRATEGDALETVVCSTCDKRVLTGEFHGCQTFTFPLRRRVAGGDDDG